LFDRSPCPGKLSEANLAAIEDAGLRFIVGARIPEVP
jgi:hypothetical protein